MWWEWLIPAAVQLFGLWQGSQQQQRQASREEEALRLERERQAEEQRNKEARAKRLEPMFQALMNRQLARYGLSLSGAPAGRPNPYLLDIPRLSEWTKPSPAYIPGLSTRV